MQLGTGRGLVWGEADAVPIDMWLELPGEVITLVFHFLCARTLMLTIPAVSGALCCTQSEAQPKWEVACTHSTLGFPHLPCPDWCCGGGHASTLPPGVPDVA